MQKEKLYYTLKDIREEIYQGAVSIATLQNMVHANNTHNEQNFCSKVVG